jgi:hypothetical protein
VRRARAPRGALLVPARAQRLEEEGAALVPDEEEESEADDAADRSRAAECRADGGEDGPGAVEEVPRVPAVDEAEVDAQRDEEGDAEAGHERRAALEARGSLDGTEGHRVEDEPHGAVGDEEEGPDRDLEHGRVAVDRLGREVAPVRVEEEVPHVRQHVDAVGQEHEPDEEEAHEAHALGHGQPVTTQQALREPGRERHRDEREEQVPQGRTDHGHAGSPSDGRLGERGARAVPGPVVLPRPAAGGGTGTERGPGAAHRSDCGS